MKHKFAMVAVVAGLAMGSAALAQGPDGIGGPPNQPQGGTQGGGMGMQRPGAMALGMHQPPAPQMVTAGEYVYILRGNTLTQLSVQGLAVLKTATIEPDRNGPDADRAPGNRGQARPGAPEGARQPGVRGNNRGPASQGNRQELGPPAQRQGPDGQELGPPPGQQGQRNDGPRGQAGQGPLGAAMPGGPGMMGRQGIGIGLRPQMPAVLTATSDYVYVLRGNMLYQFAVKGLTLQKKAILPEARQPMPNGMARPGGNRLEREGREGGRRGNAPADRPQPGE